MLHLTTADHALDLRLRLDCGTMAWICNGALREGTDPEVIRTTGLFANSKGDDGP